MQALALEVERALHGGLGDSGFPGIGQAHANPRFEVLHLGRGERLLRRHLQVRVVLVDRGDEAAGLGPADDNGGSVVAALEQTIARVEQQAAFGLAGFGAVAFVAGGDEDGADAILEKLQAFSGGRVVCARGRERQEAGQQNEDGAESAHAGRINGRKVSCNR